MKRLRFTVYSRLVRPAARLIIGNLVVLVALAATLCVLAMITGVTVNFPR